MKKSEGFTLIEVLVVVAMIGILTAIALPNYTDYVQRGRRAEAKGALQQAVQWMERAQTANGTYPLTAAFPASLSNVPSGTYTITLASANGTTYTLTATPTGVQASDKCGAFTITGVGVRAVVGATAPMDAAQCWQR
ncbi:MAG: prepilin-type N-terminal cleavage/methylation domain-containing protein [Hylemonella sp.]|nr:prepilin-type N-terminal cleavage/methylation domain-containing protein [Hylemonella sp.]